MYPIVSPIYRYKITFCTMTKGDFFIDIEYYTA